MTIKYKDWVDDNLTALPGASVDGTADKIAIIDDSTDSTKYITPAELVFNTGLSASGGSSLIGFIQAGVGALLRLIQAKLRDVVSVKDFGAVGDGTTDDTTAIAAAVLTGKNIYFPGVSDPTTMYYRTTAVIALNSNQRVYGDGWSSIVRLTGSTTPNVFSALSKDHVEIVNLHIYAGGGRSSGADGCGVYLQSCTKSLVENCDIENPGSSGIQLYNTNDSKVLDNRILAGAGSVPLQEVDIYLRAGSNRNVVRGNHCISSGDSAIAVQTVTAADAANDNIIQGNVVDTYARYGIYVYRQNASDFVLRTKISGNSIRNITGASSDDAGVTKPFGTGVYVQGAEYTVVSGNTIDTVNAQTNDDTLAPGAIGTTNVTNVSITGNVVRNCTREGITVRDPNGTGATIGGAVVLGNTVLSVTRTAIQVVERGRVQINDNFIDTAVRGVYVVNTSTERAHITIVGNDVRNIGASNSIDVQFCKQVKIANNQVTVNAADGIIVFDSSQVSVLGNTVANGSSTVGSIGIQIRSTVTGCIAADNFVTQNETGMVLSAACQLDNNYVTGNTTNISGAFPIGPNTQTGATYTITRNDTSIIANRAGTVTLTFEAAAGVQGKRITIRTIQAQTVVSAASNVVPIIGGAAGTAILAATDGAWAELESDGTNWQIMASYP